MIDVKCFDCKNCKGRGCAVYGSNADRAIRRCASDSYKYYIAVDGGGAE